MPPHKEIETLFDLSVHSWARFYIARWWSYFADQSDANADYVNNFISFLDQLPGTIVNDIVAEIVKEKCCRIPERDIICDLLFVLLVSKLTRIDLSDLVKLGEHTDTELDRFEETILSVLPRLTKLTSLLLATHVLKTTLPICSDRILEGISYHVQQLRVLDISNNNLVTDSGLEWLIPFDGKGCPLLEELIIFECSVSADGVALVIENLPRLRILGYKDTGNALRVLFRKFFVNNDYRLTTGLNLTHVNQTNQRCTYFDDQLVEITKKLCPFAFNLKVFVKDHHVPCLKSLSSIKSLDLTYRLSTLGKGTVDFLNMSGHQLYSLNLTCGTFSSKHFIIIGKHCPNLKYFWFTSYNMSWDLRYEDIEKHNGFSHLETLYFRVGFSENDMCVLPLNVLKYILRNTSEMRDLRIICRSETLTDSWLRNLWQSFKTDMLRKVLIALPYLNLERKALALTMASVNFILECSPHLKYLGNLLIWNVSTEEIDHLLDHLYVCNYDIDIANRPMKIK